MFTFEDYTFKFMMEQAVREKHSYYIALSLCCNSVLQNDYDPLVRYITELEVNVKWERAERAASVLEKLVKHHHQSDETWDAVNSLFITAMRRRNCIEREVFTKVTSETLDTIVAKLSKRFDGDEGMKTKLLLFALENCSEDTHSKLVSRAITFLSEKSQDDSELLDGVGRYDVYLAVVVAPLLLNRNVTELPIARNLSILLTACVRVAVTWPVHHVQWIALLREGSISFRKQADVFDRNSWTVACSLFEKCIHLKEAGVAVPSSDIENCADLSKLVEKAVSLKSDKLKKASLFFFIWRSYCAWKNCVQADEVLILSPENNWISDVDKIIDDKVEGDSEKGSPAKKARLSKERREVVPAPHAGDLLTPERKELCGAYELCCAAVCALGSAGNFFDAEENLRFSGCFPRVQRFINESLLFKCKSMLLIERLDKTVGEQSCILNAHLACAHILNRNWLEACSAAILLLDCIVRDSQNFSERENEEDRATPLSSSHFRIVKESEIVFFGFDIMHHVLFKVYTSTAVDHENDKLLGALLVLSQYDFPGNGNRSFNRIMRHIEAKGSLIYPELIRYICNEAILEEFARILEYCAEYVTVQVAVPQVQRRIGQSTRHSVRGTKDGQKQSVEEQMRKCGQNPTLVVASFFTDNRKNFMEILAAR